jgi:hypothetical protein
MLFSFSINTYLYNMILSEETLRYPASYYCPSPLIHTCTIWYCQKKYSNIQHHVIVLLRLYTPVQYDIVRRNTKISSIILLSFFIYTYLYNMILSAETLRYPASYCCPSPLIHTSTIWYCQKKHSNIQHHVIFLFHLYIPIQYDIVRRNTKISSIILLSFSIIHTCTIWYCQKKH